MLATLWETGEKMKKEEMVKNTLFRYGIQEGKNKRYGTDGWRKYSKSYILKRALHRLKEVVEGYDETKIMDTDNLVDAMNFCDMILIKENEEK